MLFLNDLYQRQARNLVNDNDDELFEQTNTEEQCSTASENVVFVVGGEGAECGVDNSNEHDRKSNDDSEVDALLSRFGVRDECSHHRREDDDHAV